MHYHNFATKMEETHIFHPLFTWNTKALRRRFAAWLCLLYFRLLQLTTKTSYQNLAYWHQATAMSPTGNFILPTWHGHLVAGVHAHRHKNLVMLIGPSFLGDVIAKTVAKLGYLSVRGSSAHGGKDALHEYYRLSQQGASLAVTVEGSRGPRYSVKKGAIVGAHKLGIPLLPMITLTTRARVLNTWDRFCLPLPFSKNWVFYGRPYFVQGELDEASLAKEQQGLQAALKELETKAKQHVLSLYPKAALSLEKLA